ncbi:MAG TPA: hypothetical protein VK920_08880 [Solirubrobacterales bacterium]|nr:hypothetical protein [Solirubrobacterales bacterium]
MEEGYRTQRAAPSDVDAMGLDKRRQVGDGTYGPTRTRIAARFAISIAVVLALAVAAKIAVDELDQPPKSNPAEAPWAQPDAPQREPRPLQ